MAHGTQERGLALRPAEFAGLLKQQMNRMRALLHEGIKPEQMCALAMESFRKTPLLAECTPQTLVYSVLQACIGNLRIGGPFPQAHLVPFKNKRSGNLECQLIVDYRGVIHKITGCGVVTKAQPRSVYEGDSFHVQYGTEEGIEHHPCLDPEKRGHLTHVYVVFTLAAGEKKFDVMTTPEVEKVREGAAGRNAVAWTDHWEQQAWKTVIKRGAKTIQLPDEVRSAIHAEDTDPFEEPIKDAEFEVRDGPAPRRRAEAPQVDDATTGSDDTDGFTRQADEDVAAQESADRASQTDGEARRAEVLTRLSDLEVQHPEVYEAHFKGAPALSDLSTDDLAAAARFIARKAEQNGGAQ